MMQLVQKWKVSIQFEGRKEVFWLYDNIYTNVLRKAAEYQFSENGLERPKYVIVEAV